MAKRERTMSSSPPLRSSEIGEFADLFNMRHWSKRYRSARVPIDAVNILPQPRKTFDDIEIFADELAINGVINPPIVALFDRAECEQYLRVNNRLWETAITVGKLRADADGRYCILIAGERRMRALSRIWEFGCSECRELHGQEDVGACYKRHFGGKTVEVRLGEHLPVFGALFRQLSENTHKHVPAHEEALAYAQFFKLIRFIEPGFSLTQFAREVGRGPETIRNAIRYCELPPSIQGVVERGQVLYGIAVELSRIHQEGASNQDLHFWLNRVIAENYTVQKFRVIISAYLKDRASGQGSLEGIMDEEQERLRRKLSVKRAVEINSVRALWAFIYYFEKVAALFESGALGKPDSPFSEGSPTRLFKRLVRQQRKILPHLRTIAPRTDYQRAEKTLQRAEHLAEMLESGQKPDLRPAA
jgi:hypothetical protein